MKTEIEEYEEEECLVLVELNGIIDNDFLRTCEEKCKLLGIETDSPILQLGHYTFKGTYEETLGTAVLFETQEVDNANSSAKEGTSATTTNELEFYDITTKKLNMTRVFLRRKDNNSSQNENPSTDEPMETTD